MSSTVQSHEPLIKISRLIEKALYEQEGISPDRLRAMVDRSARFTHSKGNRRYHQYVFDVEGNVLYGVAKLREVAEDVIVLEKPEVSVRVVNGARIRRPVDVTELRPARPQDTPMILRRPKPGTPGTMECPHCNGEGTEKVFNPCDACDTKGCPECDNGYTAVVIKCQRCNGEKRVKVRFD